MAIDLTNAPSKEAEGDKGNQIALAAPYFDPKALREELTGLFKRHDGREGPVRSAVLSRLKALVKEAQASAEKNLIEHGDGRACAEGLSLFQDELIHLIYEFAVHHLYRVGNPSSGERMAVVATGGYGRGLLAPGSDIDLLFLLPYKQTAWGESVVEFLLYFLWDLGFKVGHATRTTRQCVKLSQSDMTIRTSLLDARLMFGDEQLFEEFSEKFRDDVVRGTGRQFIEAKLEERNSRHRRSGASRYVVEPNIKEGKGGLRDLHTLHWLAKYIHDAEPGLEGVSSGIFSETEQQTYRQCEGFLWTIRCHLHFLTGRAEERLTFDHQRVMAERLGYRAYAGLQAVERFMKHYFMIAKEVGDLTRIACAVLEIRQLKHTPDVERLFNPMTWRKRVQLRNSTDFRIENGRLNAADKNIFKRDPVNLIRLFAVAVKHNVPFHPEVLRLARRSLRLIDDKLRANAEANRLFMSLLTSKTSSEDVLRKMNEAGVLGRFIPPFGRVISMMQFNMYHHFTVDEHLIRTVGILSAIERGELGEDLPLSTAIISQIQNRTVLYVAAFLHDIAKGRDEDHSIAGARIARELCPRFGMTPAETDNVAWLIQEHLTMSTFAQSRDINDRKTISDFAEIVQSPERLRLLVILTACDIRAVGPGVWTGWKGQLLRTLYQEVEPHLTGGPAKISAAARAKSVQEELKAVLSDWTEDEFLRFLDMHFPDYWLRTEVSKQAEHAGLARRVWRGEGPLVTAVSTDSFAQKTEITVLAPNHSHLLATIAGACSAAGADIIGAQIATTRDGFALDSLFLQTEIDDEQEEIQRGTRITDAIASLLKGEKNTESLLAGKRRLRGRISAFHVEPQVVIDNTVSDEFTVVEINGLDRPGLLYDLTRSLSELNLDIHSAHIATFGEKAVDVFYVTDLIGGKIIDSKRRQAIQKALAAVLAP